MTETTTYTLEVPGAVLAYDVHRPDTPGEHRPLLVFGSPMGASGFAQLVGWFGDRTVITYDPRVSERSTLEEGAAVSYEVHGDDVHRVVAATGLGPVDVFASSGGAVAALPWLLAHPEEVGTVVAHEPPLTALLEDGEVLEQVTADIVATYRARGHGPAMAKFIQLVMYDGPLPDDFLDRPAPDPAAFGFSAEDDGSRDDALLGRNMTMPAYRPTARPCAPQACGSCRPSGRRAERRCPAGPARRSRRCWEWRPSSSPATTAGSPPTSGRRRTTRPPSRPGCARSWTGASPDSLRRWALAPRIRQRP